MSDMAGLIEPIIPALRRYARGLLRDRAAADDLVQDCLERAVGQWRRRRDGGDPRTWLFAILHNLAMTRFRRAARHAPHIAIDDADERMVALPAPQEDGLRYRELLQALSRLPDEQRAALLLVTTEDLSYAQAAAVLGVPIGTVMSRLSRARERLLRELSGEAPPNVAAPHLRRVK